MQHHQPPPRSDAHSPSPSRTCSTSIHAPGPLPRIALEEPRPLRDHAFRSGLDGRRGPRRDRLGFRRARLDGKDVQGDRQSGEAHARRVLRALVSSRLCPALEADELTRSHGAGADTARLSRYVWPSRLLLNRMLTLDRCCIVARGERRSAAPISRVKLTVPCASSTRRPRPSSRTTR